MTNEECVNELIEIGNVLQIHPNSPKGKALKKAIELLRSVSFPESKEMKQLYSDLLRIKHDTMNIDSLIDKVYADMRGNDE